MQNERNRHDMNNANDSALQQAQLNYLLQKGITDRQTGLYDTLKGIIGKADAQGQFDPGKFISLLRDDMALNQSQDLGNAAGAMRIMGFRPGDSEYNTRTDAIRNKYDLQYRQQDSNIRRGLFQDKLGAYEGAASVLQGAGNNTNAASSQISQLLANQAAYYQSQMQNPMGLLQGIMPYLQQQKAGTNSSPAKPMNSSSINYYPQSGSLFDQLNQYYNTNGYTFGGQQKNRWGF